MILVLASIVDEAAVAFARELANVASASVLTCRDLAEERTVLRHPDFHASSLSVGAAEFPVARIDGVINLLPVVFPDELFFYPPEERQYQASEFHALLTFLLSALSCPVLNRPTPSALCGPYANFMGWHHLASRMGIAVSPMRLDTDDLAQPFTARRAGSGFEVSCLGERLICASGTAADQNTVALARRAKVEYLRATYENREQGLPRLVSASAVPDIRSAATRRALVNFFERSPR
jgi:hypothetical protein